MEKWISVKDKLPDKDGCYLVTRKWGINTFVYILNFDRCFGWYDLNELYSNTFDDEYNFEITNVVAWMPLPKAYEIEEEK